MLLYGKTQFVSVSFIYSSCCCSSFGCCCYLLSTSSCYCICIM